MKYLFFALLAVVFSFANSDGYYETGNSINSRSAENHAVALTLINDRALPGRALGLDVFISGSSTYILSPDSYLHRIQAYDEAGGIAWSIPLDAENESCWGIAWNNNPEADTYYTNDASTFTFFYTEDFGTSWTTELNPSGTRSRGMDFDGTDYWCTNGTRGGLWRFQPGVSAERIDLSVPFSFTSGLTVFPYGENLGIAVTCYSNPQIYFYEWRSRNNIQPGIPLYLLILCIRSAN